MITVVIPTLNAQASLPRCFESLVPATVRGLVREVIVADGGSTDATLTIAGDMGATILTGGQTRGARLRMAVEGARFDWLLFMRPSTALEAGWDVETEAFVQSVSFERPRAAAFRCALEEFGASARWMERMNALRASIFALPYGYQGLLIPKRLYRQIGGYRDVPMEDVDLVRRVGRRRLVLLHSRMLTNRNHLAARNWGHRLAKLAIPFLWALRFPTSVLARLGG